MTDKETCPIIFLDMDGVLADFIQSALRLHFGIRWREVLSAWPKGKYFAYKEMGLTTEQFWTKIDAASPEFWADMPKLPWADDLVEVCQEFGKVCLLSSPSRSPHCVQGKLSWIHRVFGKKFRDYVFTPRPRKMLLAAPDRYLIEDSECNAEEFVAAGGGGAIVIPQPWNSRPPWMLDVATNVRTRLETLLCKVK